METSASYEARSAPRSYPAMPLRLFPTPLIAHLIGLRIDQFRAVRDGGRRDAGDNCDSRGYNPADGLHYSATDSFEPELDAARVYRQTSNIQSFFSIECLG